MPLHETRINTTTASAPSTSQKQQYYKEVTKGTPTLSLVHASPGFCQICLRDDHTAAAAPQVTLCVQHFKTRGLMGLRPRPLVLMRLCGSEAALHEQCTGGETNQESGHPHAKAQK